MTTIPAPVRPIEIKAEKEPSFWISKQDWFTVQMYVEIGLLLPTNPAEMPFDDVRAIYREIKAHCRIWKECIYPTTLKLASELSDYSQTARTYYGALKKLLPDLRSDSPSESVKKELNLIVEHLNGDEDNYLQKAEAVSASIGRLRQDYFFDLKKLYQLQAIYNFQFDSSSTHLALLGIKLLKNLLGNTLTVFDKIYQLWQLISSEMESLKLNPSDGAKALNNICLDEQTTKLENVSQYSKNFNSIF